VARSLQKSSHHDDCSYRKCVLVNPLRWLVPVLLCVTVIAMYGATLPASAQAAREKYQQGILEIQRHIEQGDFDSARQLIHKAMVSLPGDGGLENLLGVVEIQQGHAEIARQHFRTAIRRDPSLLSAYLNLGRIDMQTALSDTHARASAIDTYDKLLRKDPANAEGNYQLATLLMWDEKYQASLQHLNRLNADDRNRIGAQVVICADKAALGHAAEASEAAAKIVAAPDLQEQDAMDLLPALRSAHRADLIESIYAAANQKSPLSADGLRILGLAQEGEAKLEVARATLESAFAKGSSPVPVLVDLTRVATALKDYQGALGYLAHARDLKPNDASFAYEFGVLSLRLSLLGESRKAMSEAVKLEPENPDYNFGMGIVSSFSQDATQGLPYLKKYHALRPSDPAATLAIGTTYFRAKSYEDASTWLQQAANDKTTAADAHYYLGRIARVQSHLDDARRELEQANTLAPGRSDVLAELGQLAIASRRYPDAQKYLDQAIALEPENYAANFALLQLYARTSDPRREQQSKRFDEVKSKDEQHYQEMMRIISVEKDPAPADQKK
jgi:tetratricopeptide (TPR) repeat protein